MTVYKTTIPATETDANALANLLTETLDPPPAVSISETAGEWALEAYFSELPNRDVFAGVIASFPHHALELVKNLAPLEEEDWVAKTQRGLHPIESGRFFVHGSHDRALGAGRAYAIEIDAGQAFGTAHHGTTRGCLLALDTLAKSLHIGDTLDLGTGSGVLAIAAAKTLRGNVLATDIDPVAIDVARANCADNGVSALVSFVVADGVKHPSIAARAPFGLVIANILAAPLLGLAPSIASVVAPGSHLILSGILESQAREVGGRYMAQGFRLVQRFPDAE
ncbi:MAG: 50S ribosomal protein L11 methyltransferase, partial [Alphaproteobacteria bacterium]